MSASPIASRMASIVSWRSSPTFTREMTSAPASRAAALSAYAFASRIWPGSSAGPGSVSSSPVLTNATRGLRTTDGRAMFVAARTPISGPVR